MIGLRLCFESPSAEHGPPWQIWLGVLEGTGWSGLISLRRKQHLQLDFGVERGEILANDPQCLTTRLTPYESFKSCPDRLEFQTGHGKWWGDAGVDFPAVS